MGVPKKIGIELLDDNLINQLLKLVGTGSVSFDDSSLKAQIDTLDKTKADYVTLKNYFNKVTEKINKDMLDTALAEAIEKATAATGGASSIKRENLDAELQSELDGFRDDIVILNSESDAVKDVASKIDTLDESVKRNTESIKSIKKDILNMKSNIQSIKQANLTTGCFVNSSSELQDAFNSGTAEEIFDLLNNRTYRKKTIETENVDLPVSWDLSDINENVPGAYTLNGTLTLSSGIKNIDEIVPQFTVNVLKSTVTPTPPYIDSVSSPTTNMLMVNQGTLKRFIEPSLPYYVLLSVIDTDGKKKEVATGITWDTSKYKENMCGMQRIPGTMTLPDGINNPFKLSFSMAVFSMGNSPSAVSRNITDYELSSTSIDVAYRTKPAMSSLPSTCKVTVMKTVPTGASLYQTVDIEYPLSASNSKFYNTVMVNPETGRQFFFNGSKLYILK